MTYFNQDCPVCARGLEIAVELLGQNVVCRHCRGRFVARAPSCERDLTEANLSVLQRANRLLSAECDRLEAFSHEPTRSLWSRLNRSHGE